VTDLLTFAAAAPCIEANLDKRTIRGLAVPWDEVGMTSAGPVRFLPGSLDPSPHLFLRDHDPAQAIGKVSGAETDDTGAIITAKVSATSAGDEALVLAEDGVLTGLSVGVRPVEFSYEEDAQHGVVMVVAKGEWSETSLVPFPAFNAARVSDVAAAAPVNPITEVPVDTSTIEAQEQTEAPAVVAAAPRTPVAVTANRPLPTPGEFLFASIKRNEAPQAWADMQAVVTAATAPHTTTTEVPGLIPKAIVGDVFSGRPEDRPIVSSLGPLTGPDAGKTFSRPLITDAILDAAEAAEKSDVTDQMKVEGVDFTYAFIKRAFNLSAEAIAFTSPQILDVAIRDLGRAYSRGSEKNAATALLAIDKTAQKPSAAADKVEDALYADAAAMYGAIGEMPDRLWVAPDAWGFLATAKDKDGRPLYPRINPVNSGGDNPGGVRMFDIVIAGLPVTVSWALTAGVAVLGSSAVIECYENHRVSMRADEPTILGTAVGVGGAIALGALNAAGCKQFTVTAQTP
jgi:HK97 family phage prohead protease